jgi:hypothetical protein
MIGRPARDIMRWFVKQWRDFLEYVMGTNDHEGR